MSDTFTLSRPLLLSLTVIIPLMVWQRRRGWGWHALGAPQVLEDHVVGPRARSLLETVVLASGWLSLIVALAGPRWGIDPESGVAVGRDIVLVLDFSRSMLAEDIADRAATTRWQAEVAAAKALVSACRRQGGERLALVVFAARPLVVAPLTTDYDHLLLRLDALDARRPPAEIGVARDDAASGTRIGAALLTAVNQHDDRFTGYQDIVLFTDADDPAQDGEWKLGVTAARTAGIPVHVVGLGDPSRDSFVLVDGEPLEGPAGQVQTRLHETIVEAIAAEGRGVTVPAQTSIPMLDNFYRMLRNTALREVSDEHRPQPQNRSGWFTASAALMLGLAWCGPRRRLR